MGLLWRLFAPRPLKKARRAMHPSWVVEDAIVRSVRGSRKRRRKPPRSRRQPSRQVPAQRDVPDLTAISAEEAARHLGTSERDIQQLILRIPHPERLPEVNAELERMKADLQPQRSQPFRATLKFPEGDEVCCQKGHGTRAQAREHGVQIAVARGYDGVNEELSYPTTASAEILGGFETLPVVGEMHYQGNLWELVGGRGDPARPVRKPIIAVLLSETGNSYDANAVSVWVSTEEDRAHTLQAGHLSRDDARRDRPGLIAKQKELDKRVGLNGVIAGGGIREGRPGYLGVFLDHDPADFGLPRFVQ